MNDNYSYKFGSLVYDLSSRTHVMGILNITPDSFFDGGNFMDTGKAIAHGIQMAEDGADFIDIGGMSTRPGSEEIPVEEELNRIIPVIKTLRKEVKVPLSVDTYRSEVAEEAMKNGALIINDISAFTYDENMAHIAAKYKATCILMHTKGMPRTMQDNPQYENLMAEILAFLEKAVWKANVEGIEQMIIDPGIGFGKTIEHNLLVIKNIYELKRLDCPVMIGVSRKSTIGALTGADVNDRLEGTIALNTIALLNGINIIRVHDAKENVRAAKIIDAYKKLSP
ncbi:MAG: dihydropteroate synthase [Ignavibacteriae bacterium]|nr:MAG: dihydropteroate synthase [Ignavibacteriota bacterium]